MELGVTTGLTLVFALLKQNWAAAAATPGSGGAGGGQLSSEVLRSALTVLRTLPPLSLSPSVVAIPRVGQSSLEQITDFLARCARVSETGDEQGSRLCVEILLCLAVLRGSLLHVLLWVGTCLGVLRDEGRSAKISADVVNMALDQIRRVTGHCREGGKHVARFNLARSAAEVDGLVDLYEGVQCVTAEVWLQKEVKCHQMKMKNFRNLMNFSSWTSRRVTPRAAPGPRMPPPNQELRGSASARRLRLTCGAQTPPGSWPTPRRTSISCPS